MVTRLDRRPAKSANEYIIVPISRTTVQGQPPDLKREQIKLFLTAKESTEWFEVFSDDPIIKHSQEELDDIIERSKNIGAINERLDSINANLEAWLKRIEDRLSS